MAAAGDLTKNRLESFSPREGIEMAIPDFQSIMLPLLQFASDQKEHSLREVIEQLADDFALTDEERKELLPSGRQPTFDNRVGWARTYLKKAGLVRSPRRGYFRITDRGLAILAEKPAKINIRFLERFEEFVEFRSAKNDNAEELPAEESESQTPEEVIEEAYQHLRESLATELLETIKDNSPAFFEQLVVDLLVRMGYGGTRKDAGQAIGKAGDEGIDGIIKEDRLGLDIIYIQAKRWDGVVGRPEIQKFAGALQGQRAQKGIFITTSTFTPEARHFASSINNKIILIDGAELAKLMIDFNVGVGVVATYELKQVDSDYFTGV
jgi:restriction system protein